MAKAGKNRHSGSTRTPPVINHDPLEKKGAEAEPVAFSDHENKDNATLSQRALPKLETDKKFSSQSNDRVSSTDNLRPSNEEEKIMQDSSGKSSNKTGKNKTGSSLLAGTAGGVIALIVAGGLQWAGFLPAPAQKSDTEVLQKQIDSLKTEMSSAKTMTTSDETRLEQIASKADSAADKAQSAFSKIEENSRDLATLKTSIRSLGAQHGDTDAISALAAQITGLEDKAALTDALNKRVAENQGALDQMRTRLNGMEASLATAQNMGTRLDGLETNEQKLRLAITALQQQVQQFEEKSLTAITNDHTMLIAANALKDAVDRGGSYTNELQTFENVAPKNTTLDLLKTYAGNGLPTAAQLSNQFTKVADNIATTDNIVPDNAGLGDKLWSSARQLVVTRPIGDVEGTSAGAIAARMEVAIEKGDYDRALSQWELLPENAKAVSTDFMKVLTARRDADRLLSQLVSLATQPQTPSVDQ